MSGEIWEIDIEELGESLEQLDRFEQQQIATYPDDAEVVAYREGIRDGLKLASRAVEQARVQ